MRAHIIARLQERLPLPRFAPPRSHPETLTMPARREFLSHAAKVAALMAGVGLLPLSARAAYDSSAFEAKSMADALKALVS
jgi:hypothetical protein